MSDTSDSAVGFLVIIGLLFMVGSCGYMCEKSEDGRRQREKEAAEKAAKAEFERRAKYMMEVFSMIREKFPEKEINEITEIQEKYVEERCRELLWDDKGERIWIHVFDQEKSEESEMFNCESRRDALKKKDVEAERMKALERVTEEN